MKYLMLISSVLILTMNAIAQQKIENTVPIDVESFFLKISNLNLNTYSIKGQEIRQYGLPADELNKNFGTDSKGKMTGDEGFSLDNKIGLNFTAVWVLAKTVQKLSDENIELKNQINNLNDNIMHLQGVQSDVMTMMEEFHKIKNLESRILELSTQIVDLQEELKTIKNHGGR